MSYDFYISWLQFFLLRCLDQSAGYLMHKPETCGFIVRACAVLHNIAVNERVPLRVCPITCTQLFSTSLISITCVINYFVSLVYLNIYHALQ